MAAQAFKNPTDSRIRRGWLRTILSMVAIAFVCFQGVEGACGEEFDLQVAEVLKAKCIRCHSGKKTEGQVDLGRRESMLHGDNPVIDLEHLDKSLLLEVISGDKPRMPQSSPPLTESQREVLVKWVMSGASWPSDLALAYDPTSWWSLQPIQRPAVPSVSPGHPNQATSIRNPIDAFVVSKWNELGLVGTQPADRRTLIRRLSYDLTGLAPKPERVEQFVNDANPRALEILVDELLDSPAYGERWARHWLDAVHYGDTHGYDKDKLRPNAWPYRDYVIRAFNEDKPYPQFVREQLAGDVVAPNTRDGIEALGMIAAGPFDFVGQIEVGNGTVEKERVRNIDRDDMVSTAMNTFVSLTVQCARCHDHKFDPIQQRDYYGLQAVFAAVDRADRGYDADPEIGRKRNELNTQLVRCEEGLRAFQERITKLESSDAKVAPELKSIREKMEVLKKATSQGRAPEYGYHSEIMSDPNASKWVQIDLGQTPSVRKIGLAATNDDFAGIGPGFGFPKRFRIESADDERFTIGVRTLVSKQDADFPNPGVAPVWFDIEGVTGRWIRVTATKLATRSNDYIFALSELMVLDANGKNLALGVPVTALDSIEAPVRWRKTNLVDGIYPANDGKDAASQIAKLEQERNALIRREFGEDASKRWSDLLEQQQVLKSRLSELPAEQFVYAAATHFKPAGNFQPTLGKPRKIHLLARGSETQPLDEVGPSPLQCIQDLPKAFELGDSHDESSARLALAEWIVDPKNPLTWRSIVNRIWHFHFGRGIVDSLNDFGQMGGTPTHPELLDWLADEFRRNPSIKDLHRKIVTSSVYLQRSDHHAANSAIDASNQYLWRMNRRRLEAEAIRDSVLQVSGKLDPKMGGPGFQLFGLIDDHSPHYLYEKYNPDDPASHRRSIYRFIVRSVPDPWMTTLDCADSTLLVDRRNETLTALQSLAMLNNRFMLRMSENVANRIQQEAERVDGGFSTSSKEDRQVTIAYRTLFQRSPSPNEREVIREVIQRLGLPQACRLLMNSNEFVFVD